MSKRKIRTGYFSINKKNIGSAVLSIFLSAIFGLTLAVLTLSSIEAPVDAEFTLKLAVIIFILVTLGMSWPIYRYFYHKSHGYF